MSVVEGAVGAGVVEHLAPRGQMGSPRRHSQRRFEEDERRDQHHELRHQNRDDARDQVDEDDAEVARAVGFGRLDVGRFLHLQEDETMAFDPR
ncbi:MAG: hypothetical protein R2873_28255 [Caldilineaceae bacterium]